MPKEYIDTIKAGVMLGVPPYVVSNWIKREVLEGGFFGRELLALKDSVLKAQKLIEEYKKTINDLSLPHCDDEEPPLL